MYQQQTALTERRYVDAHARSFNVQRRALTDRHHPGQPSSKRTSFQFPEFRVSFARLPSTTDEVTSSAQQGRSPQDDGTSHVNEAAKRFRVTTEPTSLATIYEHGATFATKQRQNLIASSSGLTSRRDTTISTMMTHQAPVGHVTSLPLVPSLRHRLVLTHAPASQVAVASKGDSTGSARKSARRPPKLFGSGELQCDVSRKPEVKCRQATKASSSADVPIADQNIDGSSRPVIRTSTPSGFTAAPHPGVVNNRVDCSGHQRTSRRQGDTEAIAADGAADGKTIRIEEAPIIPVVNDVSQQAGESKPSHGKVKTATPNNRTLATRPSLGNEVKGQKAEADHSVVVGHPPTGISAETSGVPLTSRLQTLRCSTPVREKIAEFKRLHELQRVQKLQQARGRLAVVNGDPQQTSSRRPAMPTGGGELGTARGKPRTHKLSPTTSWRTWRGVNDSDVYRNVERYIADNGLMPRDKELRIVAWLEQSRRALQAANVQFKSSTAGTNDSES